MLLHCALLLVAPAPSSAAALPQEERAALVRQQYETLADRRDAEALAQLWKKNRDLILPTFDADLEAGLAVWEESPDAPDLERVRALHERALFAAEVASEATGSPVFADYAAAFVAWNDDEKRSFRAGQAIHRRAQEELKAGNLGLAITAAQEVRERAVSLGDWWGTAMGYAAEGRALRENGHLDEALAAHGVARLLYRDLGLVRSELQNLRAMAELAQALERWSRARVLYGQALALARESGAESEIVALLRGRAAAERSLGRGDEADATEAEAAEIEELRGGK